MKSVIAALGIGVFASLVLFWLMQVMIMPEDKSVTKTISLNKMDFVRLKHEQPPKEKPKPPEKPKQPEPVQSAKKPQPPKKVQSPVKAKPKIQPQKVVQKPVPDLDIPKLDVAAPTKGSSEPQVSVPKASTNQGSGEGIDTSPASGKDKGNGSGMGQGTGNGINSGVIALVRIPPKYPKRAASRGIQGWVKIEFTITSAGTVKDAVVVDAKPGNIFDEAALDAISKWKFKEKIVNGVAVEQRAVQVLQFKLK